MKVLLMAAAGAMLHMAPAAAEDPIVEIREVIEKYLDGTSEGRPELVEEAFLPSLEVQWLSEDDALLRRPGPDYISRIEPGVAAPRFGRIVSIDATDKSAMAKAEIIWNDRIYTDYMLLLKVEGRWRIANKIATWTER
ncbi:MAG: hypothetical protein Tsb0010_16350 [Parvularculaceae bacterium]